MERRRCGERERCDKGWVGATGRCPEQPRETACIFLTSKTAPMMCVEAGTFRRDGGGSGRSIARGSGKKVYETPTGRACTVDPHVVSNGPQGVRKMFGDGKAFRDGGIGSDGCVWRIAVASAQRTSRHS